MHAHALKFTTNPPVLHAYMHINSAIANAYVANLKIEQTSKLKFYEWRVW